MSILMLILMFLQKVDNHLLYLQSIKMTASIQYVINCPLTCQNKSIVHLCCFSWKMHSTYMIFSDDISVDCRIYNFINVSLITKWRSMAADWRQWSFVKMVDNVFSTSCLSHSYFIEVNPGIVSKLKIPYFKGGVIFYI